MNCAVNFCRECRNNMIALEEARKNCIQFLTDNVYHRPLTEKEIVEEQVERIIQYPVFASVLATLPDKRMFYAFEQTRDHFSKFYQDHTINRSIYCAVLDAQMESMKKGEIFPIDRLEDYALCFLKPIEINKQKKSHNDKEC